MMGLSEEDWNELTAILTGLGVDPAGLPAILEDFPALASDTVLGRGDEFSLRDLAASSGSTVDDTADLLGHLGITVEDPDDVLFCADDQQLTDFVAAAMGDLLLPSEGVEMLHVMGAGLQSLAEAAVASHVQGPERRSADIIEHTRINVRITELGLRLGEQLPTIFRHHLRQAAQRQRRTQSTEHSVHVHLAIGFIDLTGFTSLSQTLAPDDLVQLVKGFETQAHELAHSHDARVVKLIGDEVMFAAETATNAVGYAIGMLDAFRGGEVTPRGGIAMGALVNLHGDYFGPVVNLAARLVDEAVPGQLLLSEEVAAADGILSTPAGRRRLRGFEHPIRIASLIFDPGATP